MALIDSLFAPGLDHVEKADLCKGYWNSQRKTGVANHVFEIAGLESQQKNADINFPEKKKERIFLHRFP